MQLGSHVTVAVAVVEARSCSSDSTPSLRTSICHRCSSKKEKKKKKKAAPMDHQTLSLTGSARLN